MYLQLFKKAAKELKQKGITAEIIIGEVVSHRWLSEAEKEIGREINFQLKDFLIELGDRFQFVLRDSAEREIATWDPIGIEDLIIHNQGFGEMVEEEVVENSAASVFLEAKLRKEWMPFFGFSGGGNVLCFDSEGKVKNYESLTWQHLPKTWTMVVADSFSDFVCRWAERNFITPLGDWSVCLSDIEGRFQWNIGLFQPCVVE